MTFPAIHTRRELFDFLQKQMDSSFISRAQRRAGEDSYKVKSYIVEVDLPKQVKNEDPDEEEWTRFLTKLFTTSHEKNSAKINRTQEAGFFEVNLLTDSEIKTLYADTITNSRFWFLFTVSKSEKVDAWIENVMKQYSEIDQVWFWPGFLEKLQKRGKPRGFGIDYDFRKFERAETEKTTYFKMQLWGGQDTRRLYENLLGNSDFQDKIVLSKVRLKESSEEDGKEFFALEDIKYNGKFTATGNDFDTYLATLSFARSEYEKKINDIEQGYSLRWLEREKGGMVLTGCAIHFIPKSGNIEVDTFLEYVLDGTEPFRLLGFQSEIRGGFVAQVVDLHTGGKFHIEAYPDQISLYLPTGTCGNSIVRFFTNLQHYYSRSFDVKSDNGELVF